MGKIPESILEYPRVRVDREVRPLRRFLEALGYVLIHQGKVRDTYLLPQGRDQSLLLQVATDRLSIFDFVLYILVLGKGRSLTAQNHFWVEYFRNKGIVTAVQPRLVLWQTCPELLDVTMEDGTHLMDICTLSINMPKVSWELIIRDGLGGSVWSDYTKNQIVSGVQMPEGLRKWESLDFPLFTPSTKEADAHDVNVTQQTFFAAMGARGMYQAADCMALFLEAREVYRDCGLDLLDTKFEVSGRAFIDEMLTSDASRVTTIGSRAAAVEKGKDPDSFDKQAVRDHGNTWETPFVSAKGEKIRGIKGLDPTNEEHRAFVHSRTIPQELVDQTRERYAEVCQRLFTTDLDSYCERFLRPQVGHDFAIIS